MDKPHLTLTNGLWAVRWPELTPQNYNDVMVTWGWVMRENSLRSADDIPTKEYVDSMQGCNCTFECKAGCPRWEGLLRE